MDKHDFFEIDASQNPAHWPVHILTGIICVIFALWVWMLNPVPQIHGDQINIVTMNLSKEYPDNFARDLAYMNGTSANIYPLLPRKIIHTFVKKFGVIGVAVNSVTIMLFFSFHKIGPWILRLLEG